jgi:hypothetical protein
MVAVVVASLAATASFAQTATMEGLQVAPGDKVDKVKEVYQIQRDPEPTNSATMQGATSLRLKGKGIWFFFTAESQIYTIRLDAPFTGRIKGIRVGDSLSKLQDALGTPVRVVKSLDPQAPRGYVYYLDDATTANFQVNAEDKVETVLVGK